MKKRKNQFYDSSASVCPNDRFGTVFESLCISKRYKSLSIGAKQFYVICRVESQSKDGKACLYNHAKEYGREYSDHCFVFPAKHLSKYGYDRSNAIKYFNQLQAAGFIRKLEGNKHMKKVNVYEFVDKWKEIE